jgi:hypothetical protein
LRGATGVADRREATKASGDHREPRAWSASMRAVNGVNRESASGDGVADHREATREP